MSRLRSVVEASDSMMPGHASSHILLDIGDTVTVPLTAVRVLSFIETGTAVPWIVISGVECTHCDAPEIVVFVRASERSAEQPLRAYSYPGDLIDAGMAPEGAHYRSRLFLGHCADAGVAALILEEKLDAGGAWQKSARSIRLEPAFVDSALGWTADIEDKVVSSVQRGDCRELPGKEQYVM